MSDDTKDKLRILATNRMHSKETKMLLSKLKLQKLESDLDYKTKIISNLVKDTKGENNPNSKLTELNVKNINQSYNCSKSIIYEIKNGKNWKHIII